MSYKALNFGKLRCLAIVIESEEAYQTSKVIELLRWLEAIGVKRVCLYDTEGCRGPDPDLLLVYGPARCYLGFPAWRIRYTKIV
ncbi:hypothetical protein GBA52_027104 [Prunus armeniaca]|nr:hypothetical protein GBA52_027104 [Prunus armeniaca]